MEKRPIEEQIRECFGRVIYTHKCHEKMAERCSTNFARAKGAQIFATALTTSGAVTVAFGKNGVLGLSEDFLEVATAIVAIATLILTALLQDFRMAETAQQHRDAAAKLWPKRESYFSLLVDLKRMSIEVVAKRRDELQAELAEIYATVPQTNYKAYEAAKNGLKDNEEYTFSNDEIDCFLPDSMKIASR
jgi:hypothetical protein